MPAVTSSYSVKIWDSGSYMHKSYSKKFSLLIIDSIKIVSVCYVQESLIEKNYEHYKK